VRLIDAAPNRLYRILLVLLYATGARRAEAARIMVEDIDSQRMVIHIRQGKGAKDRDVPLSPKLLEELRSWCASGPKMVPRPPHRSSFRIIFQSNRARRERGVETSAGRARCAGPARIHEKPIAGFLPQSRQRLPSNRSSDLLRAVSFHSLRLIARSSSDRVLTFYSNLNGHI
jgi:integrase